MTRANGLTIVMGNFNAAIGESVQGVVGPQGLGRKTNDNRERLVSLATSNGMCITNTLFPHKRIHQTTWYAPNPSAEPSLKDYVLRVHRGADIDSDHRLVVLSIRHKLQRKVHRRQQSFDAQLCKKEDHRREYMEEVRTQFDNRKQQGNAGEMGRTEEGSDPQC